MFRLLFTVMICGVLFCSLAPRQIASAQAQPQTASEETKLTVEQMKVFLLNAKVIKEKQTTKGITAPSRFDDDRWPIDA